MEDQDKPKTLGICLNSDHGISWKHERMIFCRDWIPLPQKYQQKTQLEKLDEISIAVTAIVAERNVLLSIIEEATEWVDNKLNDVSIWAPLPELKAILAKATEES